MDRVHTCTSRILEGRSGAHRWGSAAPDKGHDRLAARCTGVGVNRVISPFDISYLLDIPARPDKPKRRDRPTIAARSASVRPHAAASRTVQTGMCRRSTAGFSVASRALAACRC